MRTLRWSAIAGCDRLPRTIRRRGHGAPTNRQREGNCLRGPRADSVGAPMEFHVLGPLEVTDGGRPVPLGRGRQRALLGLLLLSPGRTVSADRIVEELWAGDPPVTAGKVVQNLVSQLRRSLGEDAIETRGRAYVLVVDEASIDATRFE